MERRDRRELRGTRGAERERNRYGKIETGSDETETKRDE